MAEVGVENDEVVPESEALPFLPDDVLIKIFEYLPGKKLFSVRAVCRRWAELALHPDLWRHRDLVTFQEPSFCKAALRLAPCARSLTLHCRMQLPTELLRSTLCAVKTLRLYLYPDENSAWTCSKALQRQASLGRLREVTVSCLESGSLRQLHALFRALFTTHGLTELVLFMGRERLEWLPKGRLVAPSLKKLEFWSKETGPTRYAVLRHLVDCHAPTLEFLDVFCFGTYESCPSAAWLVKAHRLRELGCPADTRDMQVLAQLEYLQSLTLLRFCSDVPVSPGIRKYLRQAKQLKSLTLICQDMHLAPFAVELVQDVASCSPSALEVLRLDFPCRDESLEILLSALPKLGALRELKVRADGAATLRLLECLSALERPGVSDGSSLTLNLYLVFGPSGSDIGCCWLGWLHKHQHRIREFFHANPALHLKIRGGMISRLCAACRESNHFVAEIPFPCTLFGHLENHVCDLRHGSDPAPWNLIRQRMFCREAYECCFAFIT